MKPKFYTVFLIILGMVLSLLAGGVIGYVLGYKDGASDIINYATTIVDRIKVENVNLNINQTKIDEAIDDLKNLATKLWSKQLDCSNVTSNCNITNCTIGGCNVN